jgi:hypothetical protein
MIDAFKDAFSAFVGWSHYSFLEAVNHALIMLRIRGWQRIIPLLRAVLNHDIHKFQ